MLIKTKFLCGLAVAGALVALPLSYSYAATAPVVKAQKIRDFARISFEWPKETLLSAGTQGNQIRLTFEQAADVNPASILKNLAPYVTNVLKGTDGRTLILSMNQAYKIRSFVSSNVNGVDILRIGEASPESAKNEKPAAQKTAIANTPFQTATPPTPKLTEAKPKSTPEKKNPALAFAAAPRPLMKPKPQKPAIAEEVQKVEKPIAETESKQEKIAEIAEKPAPPEVKKEVEKEAVAAEATVVAKSESDSDSESESEPAPTPPPAQTAAVETPEKAPVLELKPEITTAITPPSPEATKEVAEEISEENGPPAPPAVELPSTAPEAPTEEPPAENVTETTAVESAAPVAEGAITTDTPAEEKEEARCRCRTGACCCC